MLLEIPLASEVSTCGVMEAPAPVALQVTTAPCAGAPSRVTTICTGLARSCPAAPVCLSPLALACAAASAAGAGPLPLSPSPLQPTSHAASSTGAGRKRKSLELLV